MRHLSNETKEAIVKKALNRGNESIKFIAQAHGVGTSSLNKWLKCYRENNGVLSSKATSRSYHNLSRSEQFKHLMNTVKLDDISLGVYCREQGLYRHQLKGWREALIKGNDSQQGTHDKAKLKAIKAENKQLKQELGRKEKALAEASALLVMKKKANLIWGEPEGN